MTESKYLKLLSLHQQQATAIFATPPISTHVMIANVNPAKLNNSQSLLICDFDFFFFEKFRATKMWFKNLSWTKIKPKRQTRSKSCSSIGTIFNYHYSAMSQKPNLSTNFALLQYSTFSYLCQKQGHQR